MHLNFQTGENEIDKNKKCKMQFTLFEVWANSGQVQDFSKLTNLISKLNLVPKLLLILFSD